MESRLFSSSTSLTFMPPKSENSVNVKLWFHFLLFSFYSIYGLTCFYFLVTVSAVVAATGAL